jgi:hypothetical protein
LQAEVAKTGKSEIHDVRNTSRYLTCDPKTAKKLKSRIEREVSIQNGMDKKKNSFRHNSPLHCLFAAYDLLDVYRLRQGSIPFDGVAI